MLDPLRETVAARLVTARAVLEDLVRQGESGSTAIEWQKGYVGALEEILDVGGFSRRLHRRRATAIPAEIARIPSAEGIPEESGHATIVELSAGGCRLTAAMELSPEESIALTFTLPELSLVVAVQGWVRRAQWSADELWTAVEFRGIPEGIVDALQAFCVPPPPETQ